MRKIVLFGVICIALVCGCDHKRQQAQQTVEQPKVQPDNTVAPTYDTFGFNVDSLEVNEHRVKRNESLYLILKKFDFSEQEIYSITQQARNVVDFDQFKPGQKYRIYASAGNSSDILGMVWQRNPIDYVVFNWQHDSLQIYQAARPLMSKTAVASGTIENSLYQTISENGAKPLLAYRLAEIFAWQINFFGLRQGDSYKVLYNRQFVDGEFYRIGEVLAAEFTHRGKKYRAYKFNRGKVEGYFTEDGKSVQKALLKAPFKFSQRISSHYSNSRVHPILKKRMPHYGIDYAAPYGTRVLSVGDGIVTEAQYRGANGNIVKIKHNETYRTAYLHLKGFASGIYRGAQVEQGQVIGYVGSTGRSTGPHLDYRLYRNDRPVNPLTVDLPSSDSVPDTLMEAFRNVRDSLARKLKGSDVDSADKQVLTQAKIK